MGIDVRSTWQRGWPLGRGLLASLAIFVLYSAISGLLASHLAGIRGDLGSDFAATAHVYAHRAHPLDATDLTLTLYWLAFAMLAVVLCVVLSGWSAMLLRRYLTFRSFGIVMVLLVLVAAVGAHLSVTSPGGVMAFPRALTCADPPLVKTAGGFLCDRRLDVGWSGVWVFDGWVATVLRVKLLLNIAFQVAASVLVVTMLAIAAVCRPDEAGDATLARLEHDGAMIRLFGAGSLVLSVRVLTEILFANWPIAVVAHAGDKAATDMIVSLMTAYVFVHGMLATTVLALTLLCARGFAGPALPILPQADDPRWKGLVGRVGGFAKRGSTLKVLISLSPILTAAIGSPVVDAILKSIAPGR